nr:hypothetical protein [Gemmatimonadaceae bacterium]
MRVRPIAVLAVLLVAGLPVLAQAPAKHDAHHASADRDHKVKGGALPSGWRARTDNASAKIKDAHFAAMGTGYHVTSGPAAIYWNPKDRMSRKFTATATFTQMKAPTHPEAYGLVFGGNNLDTPKQSYVYVLVRGDGKMLVNHRAGADVHKIIDWTANAAVNKEGADGKATNTIAVDATRSDSVRVMINGKPVAALEY